MKKKYFQPILAATIVFYLISGLLLDNAMTVFAQSAKLWSDPVNLSKSGASAKPSIFIDRRGGIHVIWADEIDGYKYVQSEDGKNWTSPTTVKFPFDPKDDPEPTFVITADGLINIFWRNKENALFYGQALPVNFGIPSTWTGIQKLTNSALSYDVVADDNGVLYISYVLNIGKDENPAGIYYRRRDASGWSQAVNLYVSQYFRSLQPENAHVQIAISDRAGNGNVYVAWDDRSQKRIYLAKSVDKGSTWSPPLQISGPEDSTGIDFPFNINLTANAEDILILWQMGNPGSGCTQYSQWSPDGGDSFQAPLRMLDEFALCPEQSEFVVQNEDFSVVLLDSQDDFSLMAWNGIDWSKPQTQRELSVFQNPATYDSVLFGCEKIASDQDSLFVIGCDKGSGGDIWFSSRDLGTVADWFPTLSSWSMPFTLASVDQEISTLLSASNGEVIHNIWTQSPSLPGADQKGTIQYARWKDGVWSKPSTVIAGMSGKPIQLTVNADGKARLILAWIDAKTGEIFLSWANSDRANQSSEWNEPSLIPSTSQLNSSPDILVDASGMIIVVYAVPINEQRGIYFVESYDIGKTWSKPVRIFDAAAVGWDVVDHPRLNLGGDGRLHLLFSRYSLSGEERQSKGLYYSQSDNGGFTWSEPEIVSEQPVYWSMIVNFDNHAIHRLWQEKRQEDLVSFHETSLDNGLTWSSPVMISSVNINDLPIAPAVAQADNLHFLQLSNENGWIIRDDEWDGSRWAHQESKSLVIGGKGVPYSLSASISMKGDLLASVLVKYPESIDGLKTEVISIGRSLGLSGQISNSPSAIIPTNIPIATPKVDASDLTTLPTQTSPLIGLNDSSSFLSKIRNIVGFLLLVGILVSIVVFLLPGSRNRDRNRKIIK